jgi:acyl dehydratase
LESPQHTATDIASAVVPAPLIIYGLDGPRAAGTDPGMRPWVTICQEPVNNFARVTIDRK